MAEWQITTSAARLEFDTQFGQYNSCAKVDTNHFINMWGGESGDGYIQVFTVNTTTWAVTTSAARLEHDTQDASYNSLVKIDTNHFIGFYSGVAADGFVQVFTVNTTTWVVTTSSARLEFDIADNTFNSATQIDTNHFIDFWTGPNGDGFCQMFTVNTTTFAVTTSAAALEFDTQDATRNSVVKIDTNHVINFWQGVGTDGFAQVFTINTTTWAITTAAAPFEYDEQDARANKAFQIDATHVINFWHNTANVGGTRFFAEIFVVNTTTWVITPIGVRFEIDEDTPGLFSNFGAIQIDSNHFAAFWENVAGTTGFVQTIQVNTTNWMITKMHSSSLSYDTQNGEYPTGMMVDASHFITFWCGESLDGYVQIMQAELPTAGASKTISVTEAITITESVGYPQETIFISEYIRLDVHYPVTISLNSADDLTKGAVWGVKLTS